VAAHGEQTCTSGSCADEGYGALVAVATAGCAGRRARLLVIIHRPLEPFPLLVFGWHPRAEAFCVYGGGEEAVVALLSTGLVDGLPAHGAPESGGCLEPFAPLLAEPTVEDLAQPADHERCPARGCDGDLERSSPHTGRKVEGAQLGVVGDIGPHSRGACFLCHLPVDLAFVCCREDESERAHLARGIGPESEGDRVLLGQRAQRLYRLGCDHGDACACLEQGLHLAQRNATATHDQAATLLEIQHDR